MADSLRQVPGLPAEALAKAGGGGGICRLITENSLFIPLCNNNLRGYSFVCFTFLFGRLLQHNKVVFVAKS